MGLLLYNTSSVSLPLHSTRVLIHEIDKTLSVPFGIHCRDLFWIVLEALEEGLSPLESVVLLQDIDDSCNTRYHHHHHSQTLAHPSTRGIRHKLGLTHEIYFRPFLSCDLSTMYPMVSPMSQPLPVVHTKIPSGQGQHLIGSNAWRFTGCPLTHSLRWSSSKLQMAIQAVAYDPHYNY